MPARPPPNRTTAADYRFHVYDYDNSARAWELSPPQPERDGMRFFSMVQDLDGLLKFGQANAVPNIALQDIGEEITDDNVVRHIKALSFGGPTPLRRNTPEVVITGGIHAREWVAPEMAYLLAEYLIMHYSDAVFLRNRYKKFIQRLLRTRRIHVIPMLNPAGNCHTVFSPGANARMWRKNRHALPDNAQDWELNLTDGHGDEWPPFRNVRKRRDVTRYDVPRYPPGAHPQFDTVALPNERNIGVDLNRNCTTPFFGYNAQFRGDIPRNATPGEPVYFGLRAGSERETQSVQGFLARKLVRTSIDYHSYGESILYPEELLDGGWVNADFKALAELLSQLIESYLLQTGADLAGSPATGTLADHIGIECRSRSFVIELDPKKGDAAGFQLPPDQIQAVFEKNIRAALALIAAAGGPSTTTCCCFGRRTVSTGERELLDWQVAGRGNRLPV
jgi:hypothetical protein